MKPDNICPECGKAYDMKPTRCVCGWYLTSEIKQGLKNFNCQNIVNGIQCDKLGSKSSRIRGEDWYCWKCFEKINYPDY